MRRIKDKIEGSITNADYASSAGSATTATTASKLGTNAGSVTQPVYFKDGVPVTTTYALNKTVPADAKFTDTTYSSLKNPYALTVQTNGTTAATYDGSAAKTVNVTKASIGLGNVENTKDADKTVKAAATATNATTADNATKLGGLSPSKDGDKAVWGTVPTVSSGTGLTELGKYIDFHSTKDSTTDYDVRITAESTGLTISGTTKGTFSGNLSGNASTATSATKATTAAKLGRSGNTDVPMTFNWAGQSGQPSWLWGGNDGSTMYVYNPSNFSVSSAKTATSATSAASAGKLSTARTVSGGTDVTLSFNYDGSANSTANIGFYNCKAQNGNTNNYPFHRFAKLDTITGSYTDKTTTVYITQDYNGGGFGVCRLSLRTNSSASVSSVEAKWLVRSGLAADSVQVAIYNVYGKTYADAFLKINGTYATTTVRAVASGNRGTVARTWTLINSREVDGTTADDKKTSTECWKTIADAATDIHSQAYSASASAIDSGTVNSAASATTANYCTGNAATATTASKIGTTTVGSATRPVYINAGVPTAGIYTLCDASSKTVRTLGAVGASGWKDKTTDDKYVPTMSFMAYWNGAYSGTSSNLTYCNKGAFGTAATANKTDFATAGHTHNYAGATSSGGSATSAVKLDTSAGGATQPIYFKDGKPVATTYALNKTVPADAKFTDTTYGDMKGASTASAGTAGLVPAPTAGAATRYLRSDGSWQVPPNTWRGIQNSLTSNSTTDSLSAAQGKTLKTLVDGKAEKDHIHVTLQDEDTAHTVWFDLNNDRISPENNCWLCAHTDNYENGFEIRNINVGDLKKSIYPVGSIYLSVESTSPASLFGGSWERIEDRFLLAAGDSYSIGDTGGEATHTLTIGEMPEHAHSIGNKPGMGGTPQEWFNQWEWYIKDAWYQFNSGTTTLASRTQYSGSGNPHNNMPPYYTVYMWKRVA